QHVVPTVAVEVIDPSKKVVSVAFSRLSLGRVDFTFLFEIRPREPIGAINDVVYTVAVQIAGRDAFRVVNVRKLLPLERVEGEVFGLSHPCEQDPRKDSRCDEDGTCHDRAPWQQERNTNLIRFPRHLKAPERRSKEAEDF